MRQSKDCLPVTMNLPGVRISSANWGGMFVCLSQFAKGTDFTPVLQGLKDDMCQCPHWGYLLKGAMRIRYADGTEERLAAGDLYYMQHGHTGWAEEDTELVEFSPQNEMDVTLRHITAQVSS
jgi:hypothetical protein